MSEGQFLFETDRCIIKSLDLLDEQMVHDLYSNEHVRQYLGGVLSDQDIKQKFDELLKNKKYLYWVVCLKENHEKIGLISIDPYYDRQKYEISYQFLPKYW